VINPAATILIVDDEIRNCKLLEALLRPEGYLTLSATNGAEALAAVTQHKPDLILLDIMMPDMDGYEVAGILKANPATSSIPIVMVTALTDRSARLTGLDAGAEEFLTKPVDRAELWLRVRNLLRLKALGDFFQDHSQILEKQVQERTDSLHTSELRFRQMADNIRDVFLLIDVVNGRILYVSPAYEEIWGRSCESLYADPQSWSEAVHPDDRAVTLDAFKAGVAVGSFQLKYRIVRPDGKIRWIEARAFPVHDEAGKYVRITGVAEDITERKVAEDQIAFLSRVHAVLSGINSLIVRVTDRKELFAESCRIAVEAGGFRMAWIGIVDQDAMKIVPVGSSGVDDEFMGAIKERFALGGGGSLGSSIAAQTITEKKPFIVNNLITHPTVVFGKKYIESGIGAMAIFPLIVSNEAVGVFALYAGELDFFQEAELKLLTELSDDIAFAIDHIGKQEKLSYLAYYDVVTGLANRSLFHNRLAQSLQARGGEQRLIATVLLDLERFRQVSETLGRSTGDQLLREVGSRLQNANDTAARIGGDVFGLILRGARTAAEVNRALESIVAACFTEPFTLGGEDVRVVCRAGVAVYPGDGADADALLLNAEAALRRSKSSANRIVFYAAEMNDRVAEALATETRLRRAIKRQEFVLHYQPKVALANGRITGVEALIRWQDGDRGLVPPVDFIPVLEETGMIVEVGRWVVEQAFVDLRAWSAHGISLPRVAVNVSAIQLQNKDFVDRMVAEILRGGNVPGWLEVEITESVVMSNIEDGIRKLSILRGMGVTVAMDDFGTGYSSLSYLGKLPLDALKIDRSFVSRMTESKEDASIVSTIIALAHGLNLKVVAEGVETEEQSNMLKLLGCDEAQGYLFSRPLPAERMEALLRERMGTKLVKLTG
jgi:diguanylate cyclase (GGDEF)-like protein/PAS domain S-box-containing protein